MSNEEIVKEIDEATNLMTEAKVKMNVALNLARGVIMKGNTVDTEAYNNGLEDAWELAKKFYLNVKDGGLSYIDIGNIYGMPIYEILQHMTPQEALAKLEAYEKKIEVGDVVRLKGSDKEYVVTTIDEDRCSEIYCGVSKDGRWFSQCNVEKTGKHIDIQSVLQQIAE